MSTDDNKALVRGYMEQILNRGELESFDTYFAEGVIFNGKPGLRQYLAGMFGLLRQVFPDFQLIIEDQIAEGDKVVTHVTFRGTHQGEYMKAPATGKVIAYTGIAIDTIIDGKIVAMRHVSDDLTMIRQLGVKVG